MRTKIGITGCLVILAPWTVAIQVDFSGVRPLQIVGFALLVISLYRGALSSLNGVAHGVIACVVVSILWALTLTLSAGNRTLMGEAGVLAEIDNALTPLLWMGAASYVGLLPQAQRERQVGLLMRSMLTVSAVNLLLQFAQMARLPWSWSFLSYPERAELLIKSSSRVPGFFVQPAEMGYFVAIMAALVVTHGRASVLLRATALLLLLATGVAAGEKTALYALLGIILIAISYTWKLVPVVIICTLALSDLMADSFDLVSSWFTSDKGLLATMSNGRFGEGGVVQTELTRVISEQPLGMGYGSKVAGLMYWAYDSQLLQDVAILGFFGLVYLLVLLTLLNLGAWRSDYRLQAYALLLVFAIAAQDLAATGANSSAAFFWISFTMIAFLSNDVATQPGESQGRSVTALTPVLSHCKNGRTDRRSLEYQHFISLNKGDALTWPVP